MNTPPARIAITYDQHQRILNQVSWNQLKLRWPWWETAVRIAWGTGFRISDIAFLTWPQIDLEDKFITLVSRKPSQFHRVTIRMNNELHAYLLNLKKQPLRDWHHRSQFISPELQGLYSSPARTEIHKQFRWICKRVGIGNQITFYSYRHAFFERLANANVQLPVIAALTGASLMTILSYVRVTMAVAREEMERAQVMIEHKFVPTPPPLA
jgi:integrase